MIRLSFLLFFILIASNGYAQTGYEQKDIQGDAKGLTPRFDVASAWEYVHQITQTKSLWRTEDDSLHAALIRLLNHTSEPYDSISLRLNRLNLKSINVSLEKIPISDSMRIRWMNDSTFIIDSVGWSLNLLLKEELKIHQPVDYSGILFSDSIPEEIRMLDSTLFMPDTLLIVTIDTAALESLNIPLHQYSDQKITPAIYDPGLNRHAYVRSDSNFVVLTDTIYIWMADRQSPFYSLSGAHQLDSLQSAMETLLSSNERRDSTRLVFNDMYGKRTPFWVSTGNSISQRFWAKNYKNDSITLWIGNPVKNEISLVLEDDIDVNRLMKEEPDHLPRTLKTPDRALAKMSLLKPDPIFWNYEFSSAFTFNQTFLSNWSKGGESSLATMLDVIGGATYNNKDANTQWINSARIQFGSLITGEKGLRKNNDLFELNSKFNRNASGKIGLSASFYMKNQLAKGYNYPNDSVVVSKFLNPGSLTIGLGAEYKPFKHTTINLAPLSYKNTFVLDTVLIDQAKHGIDNDKRSKQELGTQIVMINNFKPMEDLNITNKLRLFSNYLNHPENIDIDWELIIDKKINWFFTIRLNLHLIYDDDIRFTLYGSDDQPILLPNGSQKKVAKTQFKEFVGLSMLFKF